MSPTDRRTFLQGATGATAASILSSAAAGQEPQKPSVPITRHAPAISVRGCDAIDNALQIAAGTYPKNRTKDMLSFTNRTGHRMTVSPNGFPVAICMCPDLTFGMLGSRYLSDDRYLTTFLGHLDALPRNMRRNGKFFINEDLLAGADRVMTQVMYPIWIWELYLATGNAKVIQRHHRPLLRCLSYIESRTDRNGIVNQVDHDDWQLSEGADWVDWCAERMEGSTCVYHTWYARALAHCAHIFRVAGDDTAAAMARDRHRRQREVLDKHFWNGKSYYDNVNFNGRKVDNFWCDSQVWPVAYGLASADQAAAIFRRIDAEPQVFEGTPMRWCAPVPKEKLVEVEPAHIEMPAEPHLRPFSWFGRLGAGDILARCATGQAAHAHKLLDRYCQIVSKHGTCMECVDMNGNAQRGTGGQGDYLEHAGGLLLSAGRGLMGIDDTADGTLTWRPQLPDSATAVSMPYWHNGRCWTFGRENGTWWIDPQSAHGTVNLILDGQPRTIALAGQRITIDAKP